MSLFDDGDLIELVLKLLIKTPGYVLLTLFRSNSYAEHNEGKCWLAGLALWAAVFGALYLAIRFDLLF